MLRSILYGKADPFRSRILSKALQFAVGIKLNEKTDHVVVDAEDALIAALKVKMERPEAMIMYVRRQNRRGDTRHPAHPLSDNPD
jgi:hypothetical protein